MKLLEKPLVKKVNELKKKEKIQTYEFYDWQPFYLII